jgi:hypothetical protein
MIYHHFLRPDLARRYAGAIQGKDLFGDAHNGLFLAGPYRTGNPPFCKPISRPNWSGKDCLSVYVDLWANAARDPGELIADTIRCAIEAQRGLLHKAAPGLKSVSIAGIKLDTHKIGGKDGATLVDALKALHKAAGKSIAFIIDEAQHALTTKAGENAMKALKSARDQINVGDRIGLMLIMSGSDRDKLMRLVNNNAAAFYGFSVQTLPGLGPDFIVKLTLIETPPFRAVGAIPRPESLKIIQPASRRREAEGLK